LIKRGVEGGAFIIEVNNKTVEDSLGVFYRCGDVSFHHISETRLIIEPEIARLAAANRTDEDLEKIENVIEHGQRLIDQGVYDMDAQLRFHYILAQTSKNPVLIAIVNSVISYLEKNMPLLNPNPNIQKHIKDQQAHKKIFHAIECGDEEAAFRQMKEHILTFGLISDVDLGVRNGKTKRPVTPGPQTTQPQAVTGPEIFR